MNLLIVLVIVLSGAVLIGLLLQGRKKTSSPSRGASFGNKPFVSPPQGRKKPNSPPRGASMGSKPFLDVVKETFPKYVVKEKNQQIMICEIDHRNEIDELVFIRLNKPAKNIQKSGRMVIADYSTQPSSTELKRDLGKYL